MTLAHRALFHITSLLIVIISSGTLMSLIGCNPAQTDSQNLAEESSSHEISLQLPDSLVDQRETYVRTINRSLKKALDAFAGIGFTRQPGYILESAVVFDSSDGARQALAEQFGIDVENIPADFSGTVDDKTLFIVSQQLFEANYTRLYTNENWTEAEYPKLIVHELVHSVHASVATELFGTEDGMGPRWFFEGIAIYLAKQFQASASSEQALQWQEISALIAQDERGELEVPFYPIYARMFRALAARVPLRWMIEHVYDDDFVSKLGEQYTHSDSSGAAQ